MCQRAGESAAVGRGVGAGRRRHFWQKDPFHCVFADDYEQLRRLKAEDNTLLFCVQLLIMERAAYRVSTFKKPYARHPHAPFHDYLAAGWAANI